MLFNLPILTKLLIACLVFQTRAEGEIRLVNGANNLEGLVEVLYDGQWGTICDDGWDITDAHVVCRQLRLGYAVSAYSEESFGKGTGPIAMDEVNCVGDEERLDQCPFRGWLLHDCVHQEDVGVRCSSEDGELRLVGGNNLYEGRIEVFNNGKWGTVCDDSWDDNDAAVVCRALGFGYPAKAFDGAYYGEGTGEIVLSNIDCDGSERRLEECDQKAGLVNNCEHSEDAGVKCTEIFDTQTGDLCKNYDVRIVDGPTKSDGLVEACYKGFWGKICANSWTKEDGSAVCLQLGYNVLETFYSRVTSDISNQIVERVSCSDYKVSLSNCDVSFGNPDECSFDAGVSCSGKVNCIEGRVQLDEGNGVSSGTVQACLIGQRVDICGTDWGYSEALVVCSQLGYSTVSSYDSVDTAFVSGRNILSVSCRGSDASLSDCSIRFDPNCTQQATVTCSGRREDSGSDDGTTFGQKVGTALGTVFAIPVLVCCICLCLLGRNDEETWIVRRVR